MFLRMWPAQSYESVLICRLRTVSTPLSSLSSIGDALQHQSSRPILSRSRLKTLPTHFLFLLSTRMARITDLPIEILSEIIYLCKSPLIDLLLIHSKFLTSARKNATITYCKVRTADGLVYIPPSFYEA